MAVRAGLPLPHFPKRTHANPNAYKAVQFDEGQLVYFSGPSTRGPLGTAALPPVTVRDAICDMPSESQCSVQYERDRSGWERNRDPEWDTHRR